MLQSSNHAAGHASGQYTRRPGASRPLLLLFSLAILLCLGWCAYLQSRIPKVAFVRSGVIVDKYRGMKEVRAVYQHKVAGWQAESDTLQTQFRVSLARYNAEAAGLSGAEQARRQGLLESQRQTLVQHQAAVAEKAQSEEAKLVEGTLNQINGFVESYARSRGYTVVLGTTQTGSLLYASDAVDITDEVLQGLNQAYQ
jgi:outer membrane protein